ncbi:MAG TPA: hypothetical protein VFC19_53040 [Candidatus Limnocylindrales bacterium]|nr:hypothetical protein [Candidatus Limnocylindrales bacterium]
MTAPTARATPPGQDVALQLHTKGMVTDAERDRLSAAICEVLTGHRRGRRPCQGTAGRL